MNAKEFVRTINLALNEHEGVENRFFGQVLSRVVLDQEVAAATFLVRLARFVSRGIDAALWGENKDEQA
jgi:hypothetical protein